MKDIRPRLKKLKNLLELENDEIRLTLSKYNSIMDKLRPYTLYIPEIGYIGYDGNYHIGYEFEETASRDEFVRVKKECLEYVNELLEGNFPDSSNGISVTYKKPGHGLGLRITIQTSSVSVHCFEVSLKDQVEKSLETLNQNQSAQNFLLNAVYVLPTTYKEYKLIL